MTPTVRPLRPITTLNNPSPSYTGEGFKGEKLLSIVALGLTIISTVILIDLTIMQRKHTKLELEESLLKKKKDNNK